MTERTLSAIPRPPTQLRTLAFPTNRSSGAVFVAPDVAAGSWSPYDFQLFADARGDVVIPAGDVACLLVAPGSVHSLAPLGGLSLDAVHVSFTEIDDESIHLLRGIPTLRALYARNTSLGDAALRELGIHEALQTIVLRKTRVSDEGLLALAPLTKLGSLDISRTRIRGTGLGALERLPVLHSVDASETRLRAPGTAHLSRVPSLDNLSLYRGSRIRDDEIFSLATSPTLRCLHLGETRITNAAAACLGKMPRLAALDLLDTLVDDRGLLDLAASQSIERLTLGREHITGDAFAELPPSLRSLTLFDTQISARSLTHLSKLPHLQELHIHTAPIGDSAIDALVGLHTLRKLTVGATLLSRQGIQRLRALIPDCAIDDCASTE